MAAMSSDDRERDLERAFRKRIRLVAENPTGQLSNVWMFWGNNNDFYFGSKTILHSLKVSLHENGRGYVAFDRRYFLQKRAEGIAIPRKELLEWELPKPALHGAVRAASLILPADYCRSGPLSDESRKKTLVLGVEASCCAEIGVYLSHEHPTTLEAKLEPLGRPMFVTTLDNNMYVSLVARSRPFDRACLPSGGQTARAPSLLLDTEAIPDSDDLAAVLWNAPGDGGALQIIDVGGVRWTNHPSRPESAS